MPDISTLAPLSVVPPAALVALGVPDTVDPTKRRIALASQAALLAGYATSSSVTAAIQTAIAGLPPGAAAYVLPVASGSGLGGVKAGSGVTIAQDGTLSVSTGWATVAQINVVAASITSLATVANTGAYADLTGKPAIPTAGTAAGTYAAGNDTRITGAAQAASLATVATSGSYADLTGKPTIPAGYTLPAATAVALGGVKVGTGLAVANDGTLSATGGGGAVTSVAGRTGSVTLAVADVTGAYASANPAGYQTGAQVTAAVQAVVGAAPAALATLQAIDAQLSNDESAASALTTIVSGHTTALAAREQTANKGAANGYAGLDATGKVSSAQLPAATTTFVRTAYSAPGAIAITDTLSVLTGSTALTMTLGNGTVDGQAVLIKCLNAAGATVTGNFDGTSGNAFALAAATSGTASNARDALKAKWSVADTTWFLE